MGYLRIARLSAARRDLLDADPSVATVARVAARWGFRHPGRFAAQYRDAFHATPSSDLHR